MASPVTGEGTVLPLGFTEFKDSGKEDYNFRDGKAEFQRIFDGPWENRQQFIFDHILPSLQSAEGETFLHVPERYPAYRQAVPYRVTVEGKLKTTRAPALENLISHTIARITVYYSTIQAPAGNSGGGGGGDINFVEESVESEVEILPLPASKFEYQFHYFNGYPANYETYLAHAASPGMIKLTKKATEEGKINHIIRRLNYRIKVPFIIQPRWGYISTYQGSLNAGPFITPSGLFAAPGQLRFDGISSITKRELQDISNPQALGWEFDFVFCYYKPGWNTHPTTLPKNPDITQTDLNLALRGLPPEETKVGHAAIIPPLFPYKFHQLVFANIPVAELLAWQRWFFDRPPEIIKRFYDPDDPLDFTVQEYLEFIQTDVARRLWVA